MKKLSATELASIKGGKRSVTWADVNGDGTKDKIVSKDGEIQKIKFK